MARVVQNVLILNPFTYDRPNPSVMVDPVLRRHAGQEVKTGCSYPLGLGYIAAALIRAGFDVELIDPMARRVRPREIHDRAQRAQAIVLPFAASHAADTRRFLSLFPDKLKVACGCVAEQLHRPLLKESLFDAVIVGEPEQTAVELMQRFPDVEQVAGLARRGGDGQGVLTPPRVPLENLDLLPFPHRGFGNPRAYWDVSFFGRPTAWVLPTRGCTYGCIYCPGAEQGAVRCRSAGNVADEIEQVVRDYGIRCFTLPDDMFTGMSEYVRGLCGEILRRRLKIEWQASARAECLDAEDLALMKHSGCIELQCDLQSADDDILAALGKQTTAEAISRGLAMARRAGINVSLHNCIFGSPGEDQNTIARTLALVQSARPLFVSFNILTPLPGSPLFESVKEALSEGDLASFDLLHTKFSRCRYAPGELASIIKKAYRHHYVSWRFAVRLLWECLKKPKLFFWMTAKAIPRQAGYLLRSVFWR